MQVRRILALGALGLLLGVATQAQAPQTPPSVTFQVEVNYVDVDAIVTDEKGNFISGLTRDDFEVFEDGKPQKVEMFSYVELPVEPPDRFAFLNRPVTSDTRSNSRAFDGRVYVIVLDDLDISPLRASLVKKSAREFVERHFAANDLAAVVYTSGRTDATQDFTGDRQLLLTAIDKFVGRRLRSAAVEQLERHYHKELTILNRPENYVDPNAGVADANAPIDIRDIELEQRSMAVLDTLRNLGDFMAGVRGRRKAVLLFSEGLEMPMNEIYGVHTATDVVGAIKDAITAAARSNVNFFALDPARLNRHDVGIHRTGRLRSSGRGNGRLRESQSAAGAAGRDPAVAGQPAHALGRNRRICRRQHQRAQHRFQPHRRGKQPVLTCSGITLRPTRATAASTRSKSA